MIPAPNVKHGIVAYNLLTWEKFERDKYFD